MMTTKRPFSLNLMPVVLLLVVGLGGWMWYLQPVHAVKWAVTMFMLPAAWGVLEFAKKMGARRLSAERSQLTLKGALMGAGLILMISLGVSLASTYGIIDGSASKRAMGVVLGLVLVVYANSIPKILTPLTAGKCDPAREQSFQRFAGWTFVLSGLAYSISWLLLPVETARTVAMLFVAAGVLLVGVRLLSSVMRHSRAQPPVRVLSDLLTDRDTVAFSPCFLVEGFRSSKRYGGSISTKPTLWEDSCDYRSFGPFAF